MIFNLLMSFIFELIDMVESSQRWILTLISQDWKSPKYVASFSASFLIVGVLVLLISLAFVWTPSVWNLKRPHQSGGGGLELAQCSGQNDLGDSRPRPNVPNFLPDVQDLQVTDDVILFDPVIELRDRQKDADTARNEVEALTSLKLARQMTNIQKYEKALKLFQHALILYPTHPDILTEYGEFLELHKNDVIKADHMYTRALVSNPGHSQALVNRQRTLPVVEELDQKQLSRIDKKRNYLVKIPESDPALKRMKKEAYFQHIHHTVAIEGNTMTLAETRMVVETRMAIPGKSILEHNEILGLESALKYVNSTLVNKALITVDDILSIHKRVLGNANPLEAGVLRQSQVFVGEHTPPRASEILDMMEDFVDWLNSEEALKLHPVKYSALAHYKLVYIHPFVDGNGRTARLLMNLLLMRVGYPPVIVRKQDRALYYEYLQLGNEGDVRPFVRFIAECTERTLDVYLYATEYSKHSRALPSQDSGELEFMNT